LPPESPWLLGLPEVYFFYYIIFWVSPGVTPEIFYFQGAKNVKIL
jgi:hypothetical protein